MVWSYWHQGFDSARLFTRLCLENKRRVAEASGWNFIMLNRTNVGDYLNATQLEEVYQQLPEPTVQKRADLIRLMLMIKYGGMWLDADAHLTRPLSWA